MEEHREKEEEEEGEEEGWRFLPQAVVTLSITSFYPDYSISPQATNTLASTDCKTTKLTCLPANVPCIHSDSSKPSPIFLFL